jgi:hypothetical protein
MDLLGNDSTGRRPYPVSFGVVTMSNLNLTVEHAVVTLIGAAVTATVSASKSIHNAAKKAAELHKGVAHKVVVALYADSIAVSKSSGISEDDATSAQRNLRQQFSASLLCFQNADMMVEISAPSKDGKKGAVSVPAGQLSPSAAKAKAAEISQRATEERNAAAVAAKLATMTPEARKEAEAANASKAKEAEAASKAKTAEIIAEANRTTCGEFVKNIAAILSLPECSVALDAAFLTVGLQLAKCKAAPKGELASQIEALAK